MTILKIKLTKAILIGVISLFATSCTNEVKQPILSPEGVEQIEIEKIEVETIHVENITTWDNVKVDAFK